jgi:hypothetical protein
MATIGVIRAGEIGSDIAHAAVALYDAWMDGYRAAGLLPTHRRALPEPGADH